MGPTLGVGWEDTAGDVPRDAKAFGVSGSSGVEIFIVYDPKRVTEPTGKTHWPLDAKVDVVVSVNRASKDLNDLKVKVSYFEQPEGDALGHSVLYLTGVGRLRAPMFLQVKVSYFEQPEGDALGHSVLYLTGIDVSLDVDTGRTGKVKRSGGDKKTWRWGPEGYGAVLLVNCDRDSRKFGDPDLANSQLVSLDGGNSLADYKQVLGPRHLTYEVERQPGEREVRFYVEGLTFPDTDFSGLVSLSVSLVDTKTFPQASLFTDTVTFRVAPWIMTPNTQPPLELYVCSVVDSHGSNEKFLDDMSYLASKANCKLVVCPQIDNRNDRWIQDEMEFGYIEAPHKSFPVVFDSPRNRGLKDFPYKRVLGPDFGYVTREILYTGPSSLDSFGNLDVSPPVTVGGVEYPLGRIVVGGSLPKSSGRRMSKVVWNFLRAQQVQAPVQLYSDWLSVGHVDEFMTFVPTSDQKGFRLLLASPRACLKLFREKSEEGYGEAAQFDGLKYEDKRTINEMLADRQLQSDSRYAQKCIDWNRDVLKQELGLVESDIIDIPQLFSVRDSYAEAFFPDMVNMLVLGTHLGIPKPFGPIINGRCCLEEQVRSLLEPLGLHCTFIDDYLSYHELLGEIHCGTNVRRKPFPFKWWNMVP
ncbi:Protein-arginine deiminase type-1 [Tupaia chinensis]|uniref:Protein-arginine deiminase type-1 n=1 Tax=Tupaia chinensis TaxID=246437 RepID=L9L1F8_TUPCH|nr:Protein-arginine deiminase type-1 [Tupaia chinensis]